MERCLNCMELYDGQYDICPNCGFLKGTPPVVASHLMPGTVIDNRYIIGTVIGHGGFGITYLAWDTEMDIKIAIKEYYPNGLVNRIPGTEEIIVLGGNKRDQYYAGLERFLNEARTIAKFSNNPNIVHVYGFLEDNGTGYIIMEYLEGIDLKNYVTQFPNHIMPVEDAVNAICEVGQALIPIHKEKIVHRDISPDNIFVCTDGKIKLLDFGAARLSSGEKSQTLSVVLKPGYAPPEQYRSKSKQGPATDVYALAATLYKLVTGRLPVESLDRVVEDTLEVPSKFNKEVPEWLDTVIMTGMAKNAEVRFSGADKFVDAIRREKVVKSPEQKIKRRRITRSAAIIVLSLVIAITGYSYFGMYSDISGEGVPDGSISLWIPIEDSYDENRYKEFESAFEEKFQGKTLIIRYIPAEKYQQELKTAFEAGNGPTMFDGRYITEADQKENLNNVFNDIPKRHQYLLNENLEYLKAEKQLPIGYTTYVLYENTYLSSALGNSFAEDGGVDISKEKAESKLFDPSITRTSANAFKEINISKDAQQRFLKEEITYYVGASSEKGTIQNVLSGYSDVTAITLEGESFGVFSDSLSINADANGDQKKISKLLLKYGLSEEGQNVLCITNQGMIPLNKKTFRTFTEINSSLSFIKPESITILY